MKQKSAPKYYVARLTHKKNFSVFSCSASLTWRSRFRTRVSSMHQRGRFQLCLESRISRQRPKLFSRGFVFSDRLIAALTPLNDGQGQNCCAARACLADFANWPAWPALLCSNWRISFHWRNLFERACQSVMHFFCLIWGSLPCKHLVRDFVVCILHPDSLPGRGEYLVCLGYYAISNLHIFNDQVFSIICLTFCLHVRNTIRIRYKCKILFE